MHRALTAAVVSAAFLVVIPVQAQGQFPRTQDGKPDLNGIWQVLDSSLDWDIQGHAAQAGPLPQLGAEFAVPPGLGIVQGGGIPYLPQALAKKQDNFRKRLTEDPEIKCYMPGVPRATYMAFPFQIEQSSRYIMIAYEFNNSIRTVHMDHPGPNPAGDSWMGWSVGHWEGDTLVVDVTGMNDQTWFDRAGDYHSDELHVTERYTPRNADVLNYEATIEDPQVFSRPWKISVPLYRHLEKNFQLMEYKCVPFAEGVLYGPYRRHTTSAEK
ncbi:MAG TPA: hypothetical protein VMU80_08905 [Bryobacteraceae bacterium]|nr:hypothetical protein [Bryobacteraceae bacterium]HUO29323.1 hypothetical protein [Bryobacteraceae bacterium]